MGFHLGRELGRRSSVVFGDTCPRVSSYIRALGHATIEPPFDGFAWRRDDIVVQDISMHLLEALERGDKRGSSVGAGAGAGAPAPGATEPVE